MKKYTIQAFHKQTRILNQQNLDLRDLRSIMDGCCYDEVQLTVTLTSVKDAQELLMLAERLPYNFKVIRNT